MEAIWQAFQGNERFQALGLDIWNGSATQLTLFRNVTEVSFPLLMQASGAGLSYGSTIDILAVVDADGRVVWQGHVSYADRARALIEGLLRTPTPVARTDRAEIGLGRVSVGGVATAGFSIRNEGDGDLVVTAIEPSHPSVEAEPASFTVRPGEAHEIVVRFSPLTDAPPGRLQVFTNDPESRRLTVTLVGTVVSRGPADPRADFDGNGRVDFSDFLAFADAFGGIDVRFDLDASGRVDFDDFLALSQAFGRTVVED